MPSSASGARPCSCSLRRRTTAVRWTTPTRRSNRPRPRCGPAGGARNARRYAEAGAGGDDDAIRARAEAAFEASRRSWRTTSTPRAPGRAARPGARPQHGGRARCGRRRTRLGRRGSARACTRRARAGVTRRAPPKRRPRRSRSPRSGPPPARRATTPAPTRCATRSQSSVSACAIRRRAAVRCRSMTDRGRPRRAPTSCTGRNPCARRCGAAGACARSCAHARRPHDAVDRGAPACACSIASPTGSRRWRSAPTTRASSRSRPVPVRGRRRLARAAGRAGRRARRRDRPAQPRRHRCAPASASARTVSSSPARLRGRDRAVVAKASAGAVEHLPIATVTNLAELLRRSKRPTSGATRLPRTAT